jgi:hypothetical protein
MDNLTAGIGPSLPRKKGPGYGWVIPRQDRADCPQRGVADFTGTGGSFRVESAAGLPWNGRQPCAGISGRLGPEYARYPSRGSLRYFPLAARPERRAFFACVFCICGVL